MKTIQEKLKAAIIGWAKSQPKSVDLNKIPISIFDATLEPIIEEFKTVYACCEEALTDEWDRSDSGFESLRDSMENILNKLGTHPAYKEAEDYDTNPNPG
jgi:molecular chaperone GrpE (heat shock protein)